jgi:hypothetical protein
MTTDIRQTKARSMAQRRSGRKRRANVDRQPDGSVARRIQVADRGPVILPQTIEQQRARLGLAPGQDAATAIDALWVRGLLGYRDGDGRKRRDALSAYRTLWVSWSAMSGSRRWHPEVAPTGADLSEDAWRACDDRMSAVMGALHRLPLCGLAISVLERVCLDDVAPPALLGFVAGVNPVADRVMTALLSGVDTVMAVMSARRVPERARPERHKNLIDTAANPWNTLNAGSK